MSYVDGFVLPVPRANLYAYRDLARKAAEVWLEHGALEVVECTADDVRPGEQTSFPQSVKLQPEETVVFSWIRYRSRAHRDEVNAKVMADPRIAAMGEPEDMGFDGMRMVWGGFEVMLDLGREAEGRP